MSAPKTIRVTAEHIERGVPQDGTCCPIALAIKEQWPAVDEVHVDISGIWAEAEGHPVARVPSRAAEFIDAFDAGLPVEPFEFTTEWPDESGVEA